MRLGLDTGCRRIDPKPSSLERSAGFRRLRRGSPESSRDELRQEIKAWGLRNRYASYGCPGCTIPCGPATCRCGHRCENRARRGSARRLGSVRRRPRHRRRDRRGRPRRRELGPRVRLGDRSERDAGPHTRSVSATSGSGKARSSFPAAEVGSHDNGLGPGVLVRGGRRVENSDSGVAPSR